MEAWNEFVATQAEELGKEAVDKWLRSLKILKFDACNLYLEAADSFQAHWFEEHIRPKIERQLHNNNRKKIKVHLQLLHRSEKRGRNVHSAKSGDETAAFKLEFDRLDPHCTFDNFQEGEKNALAYRLLTAITGYKPAEGDTLDFNPVYIWGASGSGKSHLLSATAHAYESKGLKVVYARAETFTEHVISAIRAGEMGLFRQAYRTGDILILDDVHQFSRKGATQEELFHTFNTLHLARKQIILAANSDPSGLQQIEPRLVSRFEWGVTIALEPYNKEEVCRILLAKAASLNFKIPPRVNEYLLQTFPSGTKAVTRALEALILRLHLRQGELRLGSAVTVPQAKMLLEDLAAEEEKNALTAERIIQGVATHFGIKVEDILGKAQTRDCVLPRQIAIYCCRIHLKMAYMKIGDLFDRDHSTIMASCKLVQKTLDGNDGEIIGHYKSACKEFTKQ